MPILKLSCAKHPTPAQRTRLIQRLTAVVLEELQVPADAVNVLIERIDPGDWGVGGRGLDVEFAERKQRDGASGHGK